MAGSSDSVTVSLTLGEYETLCKKAKKAESADAKRRLVNNIVDELITKHYVKYVPSQGRIYRYTDGVYKSDGYEFIGYMAEGLTKGGCNNHLVNEIIGSVKRRTATVFEPTDKNPNILNVKNGLLDLTTGELMPHTPDHVSFTQLPVNYDPKADCPIIKKYLHEVVKPEDIPLLIEVAGWTIHWWEYRPHKAVMLYGVGRNGKGTFLRLLTAFLGPDNVSCVGLQKLVSDRFAPIDLVNKAANLAGDLPARDLSDSDMFKSMTGQDMVRVENKGEKSFNYTNWAKMIFGANKLPKTPDNTDGFYSRWIIIEFPFRFGPGGRPIDNELEAKMQSPEELSGLLNLALEGLQRLKANGFEFSYRLTLEDVRHMYMRLSDPVFAFVQDCCEVDFEGYISKKDLHRAYKKYAAEYHLQPVTPKKFSQSIEDQDLIPLESGTAKGGSVRVWRGLKLNKR